MDGSASQNVEEFLSSEHPLSEYKELIQSYKDTAVEISGHYEVVWFDMFQLNCNDIKHGLSSAAQGLSNSIIQALAQKHLDNNKRSVGQSTIQ